MSDYNRLLRGFGFSTITLSIGDDLTVWVWGNCKFYCRFIKVTRKGFNIVDLDTNRCILKKPIYAKGMAKKEFNSSGPITGSFWIPDYLQIAKKEKHVDKTG